MITVISKFVLLQYSYCYIVSLLEIAPHFQSKKKQCNDFCLASYIEI